MTFSSQSRQKLRRLGMTGLLVAGGIYALASLPLCPQGKQTPPRVLLFQKGTSPLEAGAAKAEIVVPHWPVTVAGYAPMRAEAKGQTLPLYARAIALKAGDFSLSLLSLDVLLVSKPFVEELRQHVGEVLLVPVHSHSSIGGFEGRWLVQVAAMGRFNEAQHKAVLQACIEAVEAARRNMQPASFAWEEAPLEEGWTRARSGNRVDSRLLRLRWEGKEGPLAQVLALSAHPTLARAEAGQLNPDYPGELALLEEEAGRGITLIWPSAVGNARVALPQATPRSFAEALHGFLNGWPPPPRGEEVPAPPGEVHHLRMAFALPAMDASRLVPRLLRGPADNLLCRGIPAEATFSVLRLGSLQWVALPFEVSAEAAQALEEGGLGRVLSIADDYLGYLEVPGHVEAGEGESKLQYFDKALLQRIMEAAQAATTHLNASKASSSALPLANTMAVQKE